MSSNLFEQAKTISAQQAAERYAGLNVTGNGYRKVCRCPLPDHPDHTASCTFYGNGTFYCFGCQAGGTSIDFTMKLFGLTSRAAAKKLCDDFGLQVENSKPGRAKTQARPPRKKIQTAISVFDTTLIKYVRFCNAALSVLTEDNPEQDKAREMFLLSREKAQHIADAVLEASQEQDEQRLEQLLVDNAKWVNGIRQDIALAAKFRPLEVFDEVPDDGRE